MEQKLTLAEAIAKRRSIRDYDMTPLADAAIQQLTDYAARIEPLFPGKQIKVRIITPDNVKSIRGWRAPHYFAIYAGEDDASLLNVGYVYQQLTVYLTALGLGTCWATSVSPKDSKELDGLKWMATIAFGKEKNGQPWRNNTAEIRRKNMNAISDQNNAKLEPARIAPSAMNNQPWYFTHESDKTHAYCVVQGFMKKWMTAMNRIDMGIALANLKISSESFKFEVLKTPPSVKGYSYIGTITL